MTDTTSNHPKGPLFQLGDIVATPAALDRMASCGVEPTELLARHVRGDWGVLPPEDVAENELSIREGLRILSSYPICAQPMADRSVTTLAPTGRTTDGRAEPQTSS